MFRLPKHTNSSTPVHSFGLKAYPGYPILKILLKDEHTTDGFEYEPSGWATSVHTIVSFFQKHLTGTDTVLKDFKAFENFHWGTETYVVGLFDEGWFICKLCL